MKQEAVAGFDISADAMRPVVAATLVILALTGCSGGSEEGATDEAEAVAETTAAQPASPWNELPLEPGLFHDQTAEYRTDTIDIPLGPGGELEYKLDLEEGAVIVYEWNALNLTNADELWSEFHGHTERVGDAQGNLMFYRNAAGASEKGALVAPFKGIHGWYLRNDSSENITVRLEVSGYYELVDQ